jgi:hypothetical protein
VREDVAQQRVHGRAEVGGGDPDRERPLGHVDGERTAFLLRQHRPEPGPFGDDRRRVAPGTQPLAHGAARLGDDLVDAAAERVDVGCQALPVGGRPDDRDDDWPQLVLRTRCRAR